MLRAAAVLLLASACAGAAPIPPRPPSRAAGKLKLQLRAGRGETPCHDVGGGLEVCPVSESSEGIRFLATDDLLLDAPPPKGVDAVDHARFRGLVALAATLSSAQLEWIGDEKDPHLLARITCPGDEAFDAARLLTLHAQVEDLMDDLGLEYLAAVPDTRMLLVFREGNPDALAAAHALAVRGGGGQALAPDRVFVVNPDGLKARPW